MVIYALLSCRQLWSTRILSRKLFGYCLLNQICPRCHTPKQNRDSKKPEGVPSQAISDLLHYPWSFFRSRRRALNFNRVILKTQTSLRITLSRRKFQRKPTVMDKISVTTEVADRVKVSSRIKVHLKFSLGLLGFSTSSPAPSIKYDQDIIISSSSLSHAETTLS